MSFPFLVKKRPPLLICATRDMLKNISEKDAQTKEKAISKAYLHHAKFVDNKKETLFEIVEPGQTWSQLETALGKYTPSSVFLYHEESLNKMPLYKEALFNRILATYGPFVKIVVCSPRPKNVKIG